MSLFHERLKELKEKSGKTQAAIAADLQITSQTFSYYINGREPSYDVLVALAEYFGVTVDYLLGRSNMQTFESDYIERKTGLQAEAIATLQAWKDSVDNWNEEDVKLYQKLLHEVAEIIANSQKAILIPEDVNELYDLWQTNKDIVPKSLNEQLSSLINGIVDYDQSYRPLKVLNRIIRDVQDDHYVGLFLFNMFYFLFSDHDLDMHDTYDISPVRKEGTTYEEYVTRIKATREMMLLRSIYSMREQTFDEFDTIYDRKFEIAGKIL